MDNQAMTPRPFTVERFTKETHDTFTLALSSGNGPFTFAPGQFNMLYLFGIGEVPISISGDPGENGAVIHTIRQVGAVTNGLAHVEKGAAVGLRGPYGTGWPVDKAEGRDLVIITGGIGLAPLRPVIYHYLAHKKRFGRLFLLYGARTPADVLYGKELRKWAGLPDVTVGITVDRSGPGWNGPVGVVTRFIPTMPFDPANCTVMMCGPEVMMRFSINDLERRGVKKEDMWVSMERSMKCGIGLCGHCQYGPLFICKNGPVFRYTEVERYFAVREI